MSSSQAKKRVVLVGDDGCGKTALAVKFTENFFIDGMSSADSFDFYQREYKMRKGSCKVTVQDTSAAPEDAHHRALAYKGCDAVIVCFDLSSRATLESIERKWMRELKEHCPTTPVYIVGCKRDAMCDPDSCSCSGHDTCCSTLDGERAHRDHPEDWRCGLWRVLSRLGVWRRCRVTVPVRTRDLYPEEAEWRQENDLLHQEAVEAIEEAPLLRYCLSRCRNTHQVTSYCVVNHSFQYRIQSRQIIWVSSIKCRCGTYQSASTNQSSTWAADALWCTPSFKLGKIELKHYLFHSFVIWLLHVFVYQSTM